MLYAACFFPLLARPMAAKPTDDMIDADLSRRALQLMNLVDMRLAGTVGAVFCG